MGNDESPAPTNESENGMVDLITGTGEFLTVDKQTRLGQYLYYMANSSGGSEGDMNQLTELLERIAAVEEALANKADASDVADLRWGQIQGSIADQSDLVEQLRAKATVSDLNALHVQVNSKASSSDLETLNTTVENLSTTVENLRTTVENLSTTVAEKADKTELNALNTTVAGKADPPEIFTATLSASSWGNTAPFRQTVTVSGMLSTDNPVTDIVPTNDLTKAKEELQSWGCVDVVTPLNNQISVICFEKKPTINMTIQMQVIR